MWPLSSRGGGEKAFVAGLLKKTLFAASLKTLAVASVLQHVSAFITRINRLSLLWYTSAKLLSEKGSRLP